MKNKYLLLILIGFSLILTSCGKYLNSGSLTGTPSPMADVGTTFSAYVSGIDGVNYIEASVVTSKSGVATINGTAVVTNSKFKSVLANHPDLTISGDNVTATGLQFKGTVNGIESIEGLEPGVLVNYNSNVGDTYKITGKSTVRTVTSKSTTDDYFYNWMDIKVEKVEEPFNSLGIKQINYWANHKYGLVAIEFVFDDGSSAKFPITTSTTN